MKRYLLLFLATGCLAQDVVVQGGFEEAIALWQSRWLEHGVQVELPSGLPVSVHGLYKPCQPINGLKAWKQVGGDNYIWFGDRLNPVDSFDAWYIGDPACVFVPASKRSIPRWPIFVLNEKGRNPFALLDRSLRHVRLASEAVGEAEAAPALVVTHAKVENNKLLLQWEGAGARLERSRDLISWELVRYLDGQAVEVELVDGWDTGFYRIR